MKEIEFDDAWPEAWKTAYRYDANALGDRVFDLGARYAYRNRFERVMALVERHCPPGGRVLDIAAAQGAFFLALAERGFRVTWNDLRDDLVPYVKLRYERGALDFRSGSVFELAAIGPFDAILACEVIEHVAHSDRLLERLARLLADGGVPIVTTPNGRYFRNALPRWSACPDPSALEAAQFGPDAYGHLFLLHPDEIGSLAAAAGLRVVEFDLINSFLTQGFAKTGALLPHLPERIVERLERWARKTPRWRAERILLSSVAVLARDA